LKKANEFFYRDLPVKPTVKKRCCVPVKHPCLCIVGIPPLRYQLRMMETIYQSANTRTSENITRREIEILSLMAKGNLNKEIAGQLNISTETVKKHLKNIYVKIGAHNKIEALNKTTWLTAS